MIKRRKYGKEKENNNIFIYRKFDDVGEITANGD
jgi:hypothetical protein